MISKFNDCNRNSRVTQGKTLFTDCSSLPNGRHRGIGKVDDQSRVIAKSTQNPCLLLWFDAPSDTVAPPLAEAQRAKLELPLQNVLVLIHSCAGAAFLTSGTIEQRLKRETKNQSEKRQDKHSDRVTF